LQKPILDIIFGFNLITMPREVLRAKLYELIKNIDDESMLIEISNYLDKVIQSENEINFDTESLEDFIEENQKILKSKV
jgi:hypothetical protein